MTDGCAFCGGFNFAYSPSGRRRCTTCHAADPSKPTEFSAETITDGIADFVVIRAENGAAGYTSYWRREQIEDFGLADICKLVESAMWRSHRALKRSMQPML